MSRPTSSATAVEPPPGRALQAAAAVLSAAVTATGVLAFGWPVFVVMLLFWTENVLIGLANVMRIVVAGMRAGGAGLLGYLFAAVFFTFHYGVFTAAHGMFVLALFGPDRAIDEAMADPATVAPLVGLTVSAPWVLLALALIAASVAIDAVRWIIGSRADAQMESPQVLMAAPYGRIGVLHVTLIIGGAIATALQAPAAAAVLLVALKLGYDLLRLRRGDALGLFERKPAAPAA
jgi:hypothetical protein